MIRKEQSLVQAMLDRSVVFGIGLMIALLGIGAVGNYRNIQSVQRNADWVAHTHDIDRGAAEFLRLTTDAVVSERGYLISGDAAHLRTSQMAFDAARQRLDKLKHQTADNHSQQAGLAELERSLSNLQAELAKRSAMRARGADLSELAPGAKDISSQLDRVRQQVAVIRAEENLLLQDREEDVASALRTALISGVITFGLGLVLFMGIVELIRRNAAIQQRQQERLSAEREQLLVTLASIDDSVISVDRAGLITHWSNPAERLTGRLRESVIGRPLRSELRLVDELTAQEVAVPVEDVLRGNTAVQIDAPCLVEGKAGPPTAISAKFSPIIDNAGRVNGAVIVLHELSEERQAETAKTERARILSIRADVGMIISHAGHTGEQLQHCVQTIGEQLAAAGAGVWKVGDEQPELQCVAEFCHPHWAFLSSPQATQLAMLLQTAFGKNEQLRRPLDPDQQALVYQGADAHQRDLFLWMCPLTIEDRRLGVLAVFTLKPLSDLSVTELGLVGAKLAQFIERRTIEEARQESEELFRTLANSIPQLAWMARPDGDIFWYNQRWFDYTGTTREAMQDEGWQAVHDPVVLPEVLKSLRHSFATGEPWEHTFPLRRHDGEFRWHLSRMLPVRDDHGRIRLWFGTNTDVTEQRNAEQRVRRVIDSMFSFVGILADDGTLMEANQAPLVAAGLTREDVIGRKFWDCHWWTHDEAVRARMQTAFTCAVNGELMRYDEEMQMQGNLRVTIDIMLQPVFAEGKLVFVIASGVDVTARKRAEEQLAASEEFLRSVLDALASHIAVLDDQGVILMVNRAGREFTDSNQLDSSSYALGQNALQVYSPVNADGPTEAQIAANGIRAVLDGERPWFTREYPCHSASEQRWFHMRVDRLTNSESTRVVVSHENITARVVSEEATRRWSTQQQRLAEIALELSGAEEIGKTLDVVTAGARRLIDAAVAETVRFLDDDTQRIERSISVSDEQPLADPAVILGQTEWIRQTVRETNRPLRLDASAPSQRRAESIDSSVRPVPTNALAVPLTDQAGQNIGSILLTGKPQGDFTADDEAILIQLAQMASVALERARLYEELREADQRKDQFLATLAHELRNPLAAISAATQLILMRPEDSTQVRSTALLTSRQCVHLKQLVDDLLDVSRISRGKLNLQLAPTRLQDVIEHALETSRSAIETAKHQLSTQISPEPLFVRGDTVRLAQVISNLLVNAAKYTPPGGKIELELTHAEAVARIAVRDNGIGIPADQLDQVFELFTQVDSSSTRSQGGLGIGLTLAKTLVSLHGGTIAVASAGSNLGSTFTVCLPLAELRADEVEKLTGHLDVVPPVVNRRILVVDDNRAAVHLLGRLLSTLGHDVQTASDGTSALAAVGEHRPEIVISDIGMPDMSGYELARRIQQIEQIAPPVLVALTGYGQESDRQAAYDAGFHHHLTKPVSLVELENLMRTIAN